MQHIQMRNDLYPQFQFTQQVLMKKVALTDAQIYLERNYIPQNNIHNNYILN